MTREVAITSWAVWNVGGIAINRAPVQGAGLGLAPWPGGPETPLTDAEARHRPALAIAMVQLAGQLLSARRDLKKLLPLPHPVDLQIGTAAGSRMIDLDFLRTLEERGNAFGSPSTFAYTLSTAPIGEVSLALGLRGGLSTVSSGQLSGLSSLVTAAAHVANDRSRAYLCGGMEVSGSASDVIALFLLEAVADDHAVPRLLRWRLSFDPEATPASRADASMLESIAAALAENKALDFLASSPDGHTASLEIASAVQRLSTPSRGS